MNAKSEPDVSIFFPLTTALRIFSQCLLFSIVCLGGPAIFGADISWTYNFGPVQSYPFGVADDAAGSLWAGRRPDGTGKIVWLDEHGQKVHDRIVSDASTLVFYPLHVSTNRAITAMWDTSTNVWSIIEWNRVGDTIVTTQDTIRGAAIFGPVTPSADTLGFFAAERSDDDYLIHRYTYGTPVAANIIGTNIRVGWQSEPGKSYLVQSTKDLLQWSNVTDVITGDGTMLNYNEATEDKKWFRLRITR